MNPEAVVIEGDCLLVLKNIEENTIDAVVTDPPYGLSQEPDIAEVMRHWLSGDRYEHGSKGFMGKSWDSFVPGPEYWREVFRVLKPGGHALVFAGTRTQDLMTVAMRFAGFEIRDVADWLYGSGFPKSLDVSKAIDKAAGAEREVTPTLPMMTGSEVGAISRNRRCAVCLKPHASADPCRCPRDSGPASPAARQFQGYGTALKPAREPIIIARKPLEGTVAENVQKWGTGALNIDGCRIGFGEGEESPSAKIREAARKRGAAGTVKERSASEAEADGRIERRGDPAVYMAARPSEDLGRWPANVLLDEEAAAALDEQTEGKIHGAGVARDGSTAVVADGYDASSYELGPNRNMRRLGDSGGASRFFYTAKTSRKERSVGGSVDNTHPTVKPVSLMRYLVRLVTPPQTEAGKPIVLDPFCGSGSTLVAAYLEGAWGVGIEREPEYAEIARRRVAEAEYLRAKTDPTESKR